MPMLRLVVLVAVLAGCAALAAQPTASAPAPVLASPSPAALASTPADVTLPPARTEGGKPLLQALRERQSQREFAAPPLPLQTLGDLLWATAGINRPDSGKRTIPSARNWQIVEVYAVTAEGAFRYDAKAHVLRGLLAGDLRPLTGKQPFVASAPLELVYVADEARIPADVAADQRVTYGAAETGFAVQNAYLFCASEGLATVVRAMFDREALSRALRLGPTLRIVLVQTVGFPAK